ncbi:hypothetical protein Cgig2_005856 [Carnegiea gigantea]|uniref:F-box domain-containing protein n=1 Tax=Carnegiea gigantea TaxID=171969 RepID=A0A9Q1QN96_9CARY|nr:hypothetical protein Cgig2_005856 [Carnegiea gigantea]
MIIDEHIGALASRRSPISSANNQSVLGKILRHGVPMSSQSNRRHLERGEALDHLSNLPDALICCILSSIPTKYAVRTSILSDRWKNIWTKVRIIDLTCMAVLLREKTKQNFNRFVNNVLLQNDVSNLHHLRFYIPAERHDDINVLKLNGNFTIDIPKSLHLPHPETIHLEGVHFRDDEFIKKLLTSCHLLKSLHIVRCTGMTTSLHIESPTLKTLEIAIFISDLIMRHRCPWHVIYLRLRDPPMQYDICELSSLVEAEISLCSLDGTQRAFELVRKFSAVTTLRSGTCRVWCWDASFETTPEPQCMSSIESFELRLMRGRKEDMRLIGYLLKAASVLKEMRITTADFLNRPDYAVLLLSLPKACVAC